MATIIQLEAAPDSFRFTSAGREFTFKAKYLASLDSQIRPLSDEGSVVDMTLLNYVMADPAKDAILIHSSYDPGSLNKMSAPNAMTPKGTAWLRATGKFWARDTAPGKRLGMGLYCRERSHLPMGVV